LGILSSSIPEYFSKSFKLIMMTAQGWSHHNAGFMHLYLLSIHWLMNVWSSFWNASVVAVLNASALLNPMKILRNSVHLQFNTSWQSKLNSTKKSENIISHTQCNEIRNSTITHSTSNTHTHYRTRWHILSNNQAYTNRWIGMSCVPTSQHIVSWWSWHGKQRNLVAWSGYT